jgi:hypothetical protein
MHRTQRARYKDVPSELSGIRVSFLLGTFLWTSKEKYRGCRSENRLQKNRRDKRHKKTSATIKLKSPETPTGLFWPTGFKTIQALPIPRRNYYRYAAPSTGGFERICPQGRCRDASRFSWGLGCPFGKPRSNLRSAGQIGRIADLHASHPKGEVQGCAE